MKRNPLMFLGGALAATICAGWLANENAQARFESGLPVPANPHSLEFPFGKYCVVTLDPLGGPVPELSGQAYLQTGLEAPNTLEGRIVHSDAHWLVVRQDENDDWIARERVLVIHVVD